MGLTLPLESYNCMESDLSVIPVHLPVQELISLQYRQVNVFWAAHSFSLHSIFWPDLHLLICAFILVHDSPALADQCWSSKRMESDPLSAFILKASQDRPHTLGLSYATWGFSAGRNQSNTLLIAISVWSSAVKPLLWMWHLLKG